MESLTINNVKYYACTDIAKKLNLKNGMEVVNKYKNNVIKKYNKWWIEASLFVAKPKEAKLSFRGITPFSFNNMNTAVLSKDEDGNVIAKIVNTDKYKQFKGEMRNKIREAFKEDKNILKDISLIEPLVLNITAYCTPSFHEGKILVKDCSNVVKPLEDILYKTISQIVKLYTFDDKINIEVVSKIVDVKNKSEEGYDIVIRNAKKYSNRTYELRCGEVKREMVLR